MFGTWKTVTAIQHAFMLQFAILFEAQLQCSEEYYNSADTEAANFQIFRFYFNSFFFSFIKKCRKQKFLYLLTLLIYFVDVFSVWTVDLLSDSDI